MHKPPHLFLLLSILGVVAQGALAEGVTVPSPANLPGQDLRGQLRQSLQQSPGQRMERRDEMRQRRDAWSQMSSEERHQFRRDIRDAGRSLYPHRNRPD